MLAMGVLLVVGGRLGDKFGQRRLFLIGISGFTLASAVAGFSPNPTLLIVARVAQGAFGALLIPQGMAIMTKAFSRDMLAKAFGLFGPVLGLSNVGGPVLAGFIISADLFGLSWRPIFLANIILGGIGLVIAAKILPRDDDSDRSTVVDGWGSGLLAATMIGLLYGLAQTEQAWCLTLATNAVVAWTTEYYGLAVESMRRAGRRIDDEILAYISPAHSENINFFGAIEVDVEGELAQLGPTGYRPLRVRDTLF